MLLLLGTGYWVRARRRVRLRVRAGLTSTSRSVMRESEREVTLESHRVTVTDFKRLRTRPARNDQTEKLKNT